MHDSGSPRDGENGIAVRERKPQKNLVLSKRYSGFLAGFDLAGDLASGWAERITRLK
jgi:hypothetical protein